MASKYLTSAAVAIESTFASVDPATGIPSPAGLTFSQLELTDRTQVVFSGDPTVTEDNGPRTGPWARPGELATVLDGSGNVIQRRSGTITVTITLRSGLTEAGNTSALWKLLLGGMDAFHVPADGVDDVTIAPTSTTTWTATTGAKYGVRPLLIGVESSGRWDYAPISNRVVNAITTALALAQDPGAAKTLRLLATAGLASVGMPTPDTLALDLRGIGWQEYAFGCRPTRYLLAMEPDSRRMTLSVDLNVAYFQAVAVPAAPVEVVPVGGGIDHQLQSFIAFGPLHSSDGVPDTLSAEARTVTVCVDALELEVNLTNAFPGCGESIVGKAAPEVTDATVELRLTLGDVLNAPGSNTGVDAQFWSRKLRQVLVGFASGQPGSDNNGACVWLPSAFLATDPAKLDTGGERLRQVLTFRPGPPAVDGAGNYLPSVAIGVGA